MAAPGHLLPFRARYPDVGYRGQNGLMSVVPERLEDWIGEDNPVRVIDVFVDELDLGGLGFERVEPRETGRPTSHRCLLFKQWLE